MTKAYQLILRIACKDGEPLLNYTFNGMGYADVLSKLIPKLSEPLEEAVIAALSTEMEIKIYSVKELPGTLEEIRFSAKHGKIITEK